MDTSGARVINLKKFRVYIFFDNKQVEKMTGGFCESSPSSKKKVVKVNLDDDG